MLTKGPDGRRITVEIRMAEQFKKFFDWWDVFDPEATLVEQNVCISPSFKVFHLKKLDNDHSVPTKVLATTRYMG